MHVEVVLLLWLFGSSFLEEEYQIEWGHQAVLSAEIIREQRDAEAEKNLLIVFTSNTVYCLQFAPYH